MASPPPLLLLLQAAFLLPSAAPAAPSEVTVGVVVPGRNVSYAWAWPRVAPALELALEALEPELRNASLAVHIAFAPADKDGTCSQESALENSLKLKLSRDPDVLLGLGCDHTGDPARAWARRWRLPLLSASEFAWEAEYLPLPAFLEQLNGRFNWTPRFVFASSRQAPDFQRFFLWWLRPLARLSGKEYFFDLGNGLDEALRSIRARARVAYIHGSPEMFQQMMRLAQAQNMTNGDYVFIYLDLLGESLEAVGYRETGKPWQSKESPDSGGLREAFQKVLIITFHQPHPPEYRRFQRELILRAQRDFGVSLNDSRVNPPSPACFLPLLHVIMGWSAGPFGKREISQHFGANLPSHLSLGNLLP
ncbi:atrial natriuretic peptide receptor 2-like isoform X2 [Paroedura picta]|uniref:atrial natriuretic peptide receptor 2-like isoform X2 n=1 Tax=Paroedura picta TaxID=143630 RepID=UPI00405732D7